MRNSDTRILVLLVAMSWLASQASHAQLGTLGAGGWTGGTPPVSACLVSDGSIILSNGCVQPMLGGL